MSYIHNALDAGIATIIGAQALGGLRSNVVMPNLVRRDFDDEVASYGKTVQVQKRGTMTTGSITHPITTDITFTTPADTTKTVSLDTHTYSAFTIEDYETALNRPEQLRGHAEDAGIVISDGIDDALIDEIAMQADTAESQATSLTPTDVTSWAQILTEKKAPRSGRYGVFHPRPARRLKDLGMFGGVHHEAASNLAVALQLPDDIVRPVIMESEMGRRHGIVFFEDQNVGLYNGSSDTQQNIVFQEECEVFLSRPLPAPPPGTGATSMTVNEAGIGLRVTMQYNVRRGWTEVVVDLLYGKALFRPEFGISTRTTYTS